MSDEVKNDVKMDEAPAADASTSTAPAATTEAAAPATSTVKAETITTEDEVKVEGKSDEEVQSLLAKAAKQIYFYFSDSNLPIDKYFFSLTACNAEGWVPIKTILTFKRMREFQPLGVPFVASALRQAILREGKDPLVAISEDGENVRRRRPLEAKSDAWQRSVYVKGFGEGDQEYNTQEKIEDWFEQFGTIAAVRRRKEDIEDQGTKGKGKGAFKGSVFVEFTYESDMKKFLAATEPTKFRDDLDDILKMTKDSYVTMKAKEKGIPTSEIHRTSGRGDKNPGAHKFNAFREMAKLKNGGQPALARIQDGVAVVGKPIESRHGSAGADKRERTDDEEEREAKVAKVEPTFVFQYKGKDVEADRATGRIIDRMAVPFEMETVIKFEGGTDSPDWKDLKQKIMTVGGIPNLFIAFPPGSVSGSIAKQDDAIFTDEDVQRLNDTKMQFGGQDAVFSRMTEEEQRNFWHIRANFQGKQRADKMAEAAQEAKKSDRREGGGHRGGRGRGGGGGGGGGGRGHRGGGGGRGRGGRGRGGGGGGRDRNRENAAGGGGGGGGGGGVPPTVQSA